MIQQMVKKITLFLVACVLGNCCFLQAAEQRSSKGGISWQTNYQEALNQSKSDGRPVLLFFTGSDWCSWCHKLEDEVLNTSDFAQTVGDSFIFVKIDFPLYSQQDAQVKAQNKLIQQKYNVRSFPSIIIVDGKQDKQMGSTGYRPGGGKQYGNHLLKIVNDFAGYKQKVSTLEKQKHPGNELKALYEKSKELGMDNDAQKIVKLGINSEESLYFLMENYRLLVNEGRIHDKEAAAIRQQLLNADPQNENQTHYQVAVIDFEAYSEEIEKDDNSTEVVIAPLVNYMDKFGDSDKENLWRLQMIISQVYLDKNQMNKALNYAELSYKCAPTCVQPEISKAIQNIQSQLHSANVY